MIRPGAISSLLSVLFGLAMTVTITVMFVNGAAAQGTPAGVIADGIEELEGEPSSWNGFTTDDAAALFDAGDAYTSIFLNEIFGPLFPAADGGRSVTVFSNIVGYFNMLVLVVGGLVFFYNVVVGTLQTAHEGKVLGQRWSSLWAPIRIVFAVGLLVPLPNMGGYNLVQSGVAYLVKGGTAIASAIWSESVQLIVAEGVPIAAMPAKVDTGTIRQLYDNAVCRRIVNHQLEMVGSRYRVAARPYDYESTTGLMTRAGNLFRDQNRESWSVNYEAPRRHYHTFLLSLGEDGAEQAQPFAGCGGHVVPEAPAFLKRLEGEEAEVLTRQFLDGHAAILERLDGQMNTIVAGQFVSMNGEGGTAATIEREIASVIMDANRRLGDLVAEIREAAIGVDGEGVAARQALVDHITGGPECGAFRNGDGDRQSALGCYGQGWLGAGTWYIMIARLNNEAVSLMTAKPTAFGGTYFDEVEETSRTLRDRAARETDLSDFLVEDEAIRQWRAYSNGFEASAQRLAALGFQMSTRHTWQVNPANDSWLLELVPSLGDWMVELQSILFANLSPSDLLNDPMVGLVQVGNYLLAGSALILVGISISSVFGASAAALMAPLLTVMIAAGGMLSLILPMMPFLLWIMAVTGFFLLVVEAVVAATLWAFGHLRMDGEGLSGPGGERGWILLLSLVMTPALMIFGFLVGMIIFRVTAGLLNLGFHYAASSITGLNPLIWLMGIIVFTILLSIVYMILLERSFSLVAEFPNRVLRWLGGGADVLGAEADRTRIAALGAGGVLGAAVGRGGQVVPDGKGGTQWQGDGRAASIAGRIGNAGNRVRGGNRSTSGDSVPTDGGGSRD